MNELKAGLSHEIRIVVSDDLLAPKFAPGTPQAFASPALVALIEQVSAELLAKHITSEFSSVGSIIHLSHTAPTPIGMIVRCQVKIIEVDGRRVVFDAIAWDEKEQIATAQHERYIINLEKFNQKIQSKSR